MSEEYTPNDETPEQKQNSSQGGKNIKSLVGSLRVRKPVKPSKESTTPIRKRKRLQ